MKKIIIFAILTLIFNGLVPTIKASVGVEYAQKGAKCIDEGNLSCGIENLEKALQSNTLNNKQKISISQYLRTNYHVYIENKIGKWPAKKIIAHCERGIELSKSLSLSGDWYDLSFYLWIALAYGEEHQNKKAKKWATEANYLLSQGKYKQELDGEARSTFERWAKKIINTIQNL